MQGSISIPISHSVFDRLERLGSSIANDGSSIIEKLIDHWESNPPEGDTSHLSTTVSDKPDVWRSPFGDALPVGEILQADYLGKSFRATVEKNGVRFDGTMYGCLSTAGVAVKGQLGVNGLAALTDGRKFWKIQDPKAGRWVSIASLRHHAETEPQLV